jgi:putative transposase
MKKRFSEQQIVAILKQGEAGVPVKDICRKHNISDATFYTWHKKYRGMDTEDLKRLKQLEGENRKLKRLLADSMSQSRSACPAGSVLFC